MKIKILPAFNGDCLLISFLHEEQIRNILIDGGVPRTYNRHLRPEIENLLQLGQVIDLLIVTHIDDDHIGGIKELYQDKSLDKSFIKKVWFNSGNLLSDYFQVERETEREVEIIMSDQTNMSVNQGVTLEKALLEEGKWHQTLIKSSKDKIDFLGLSITILSPTDKQLKKLHKKWEIETNNKTAMSNENDDFAISISELCKRKFKEDNAIPNGSSIALLIEKEGKNMLFLGDAHPSVVAQSLLDFELSTLEDPLKVNLVKVSHHASKGNTSPKLLSLISSTKFIISTDGSAHGLPDKEAIARIILFNPGCELYFNYDEISRNIFIDEDMENHKFDVKHLSKTNYIIEI